MEDFDYDGDFEYDGDAGSDDGAGDEERPEDIVELDALSADGASDDGGLAGVLGALSFSSRRSGILEDPRLKKLERADDEIFVRVDNAVEERLSCDVAEGRRALELAHARGDASESIAWLSECLDMATSRLSRHEEKAQSRRQRWATELSRAAAYVLGDPSSARKLARLIRTLAAWAAPWSSKRAPDEEEIVQAACDLAARRFSRRLASAVRARARLAAAVAMPGSTRVEELRERLRRRDKRALRLEERLLYVAKPARLRWEGDEPVLFIPTPPPVLGFLDRLMELGIPRPNLPWVEAELNDYIVDKHFMEQFYVLAEPIRGLWGRAEPAADGYIRPAVRLAITTLWEARYGAEPSVVSRLLRELDDMEGEDLVGGAVAGAHPEATPAARCAAQAIIRAISQGFLCHPRPAPPDAARLLRGVEDAIMAEAEAASKAARRDRQLERRRLRRAAEGGELPSESEEKPVAGDKRVATWPAAGSGSSPKKPKSAKG